MGTVEYNMVNKKWQNDKYHFMTFIAFGKAIKVAWTERKESRKDVSDAMNISPCYLLRERIVALI